MPKLIAFEYLVNEIVKWLDIDVESSESLSLDKLKLIKLHFFICAISSNKNGEDDLFDVFDNFHALPLGPVESDIYNYLSDDALTYYKAKRRTFEFKKKYEEPCSEILSEEIKNKIKTSILQLDKINPELKGYSAFDLVDLSHEWSSWNTIFTFAQSQRKSSAKIPVEIIRKDQKIFSL